jgi:outer membrane protein assembly factor BamD
VETIIRRSKSTALILGLVLAALLMACGGEKAAPLRGVDYFYGEGDKAFERKRYQDAIEHYRRVVSNFPGSSRVADAQYYLAECHFRVKDYVNASFEYQRLVDAYPSSEWAATAKFQVGESYFLQRRRSELDQKETLEAIMQFRNFLEDFPDSPLGEKAAARIVECRARLAKKEFDGARLYESQNYMEAAKITYEATMRSYPDTRWYYESKTRLGLIAQEEGNLAAARLHWTEVIAEAGEEQLKEQVRVWLSALDAPVPE